MSDLYGCDLSSSVVVDIPEAAGGRDGVTYYKVRVRVGTEVEWFVERRYRDFAQLHSTLVADGAVQKDGFPQKRLLGNRDPAFIMKRRKELEAYLQSVFKFLCQSLPESLSSFLHLERYDVNFVLRRLAEQHFHRVAEAGSNDSLDGPTSPSPPAPPRKTESAEDALEALEASAEATEKGDADRVVGGEEEEEKEEGGEFQESWTPLEMHAIAERLRSSTPLPRCAAAPADDPQGQKYDFANVADRACQLGSLRITGSDLAVGTSNIVTNKLKFDFLAFKSLTHLCLDGVPCRALISSFGAVRSSLRHLRARRCSLRSLVDILLCDTGESVLDDVDEREKMAWTKLEKLDLADNEIAEIDRCAVLLSPRLKVLSMPGNKVSEIDNVAGLTDLNILDLCRNDIEDVVGLNARLGQLSRLDLAENRIKSLAGFSKLYSLQHLNLSANRIGDLPSVEPVSGLPCLESLNLQGNKVTSIVDYRIKVFELFGKRCPEICLDNETPSQQEVDKFAYLLLRSLSAWPYVWPEKGWRRHRSLEIYPEESQTEEDGQAVISPKI